MTAKGKINASKVQINDRIIVKVSADGTVRPSDTKTGEGVQVARVTDKGMRAAGSYEARGKYIVHTPAGSFEAAPIQTMWLAPEDAAGIKRAFAEALGEDRAYEIQAEAEREDAERATPAVEEMDEPSATAQAAQECPECGGPLASDGVCADDECGDDDEWQRDKAASAQAEEFTTAEREELAEEFKTSGALDDAHHEALVEKAAREAIDQTAAWLTRHDCDRATFENVQALITVDHEEALTLNSHDGNVVHMSNETATQPATGSAVVTLLEKVWARIREDHPQLPDVVIVTGSGALAGAGSAKWGHFRADGWKTRTEGVATNLRISEMFMAGETLAKGARQVLQTMLHEGAHSLAKVREVQDTSRQGRWHNAKFRSLAEEMGLEYRSAQADTSIGFSGVVLTEDTTERYADLLVQLDREINLVVSLPGWLGGDDDETEGGEQIGRGQQRPRTTEPSTSSLKLTCVCVEPVIIRASKKVAEMMQVRCDECTGLFLDRS